MTKEERKKQHMAELNRERVKRFHEKHGIKQLKIELDPETYNRIDTRLKADGVSKKDFILKSFEKYEKNGF